MLTAERETTKHEGRWRRAEDAARAKLRKTPTERCAEGRSWDCDTGSVALAPRGPAPMLVM